MQIQINLNGTLTDITENVVYSSLTTQSRSDEAFATGSFQAWLKGDNYKYNIPPDTICMIGSEYWLCKSECTKYLLEDELYIHNFTLIEATSILSCYLVGTKAFSNTGTNTRDIDKATILCALVNQKYGMSFSFSSRSATIVNGSIEYTFSAGSTLFDCLSEIAKHYNSKIEVFAINYATNTIDLGFSSLSEGTYTINTNDITNVTFGQNDTDYCKYLESESANVVDRTNHTLENYITVRADDTLLNADTAKIYLGNNIEELVDFGVHAEGSTFEVKITITDGVNRCTYITTPPFGQEHTWDYQRNNYQYEKDDGTKELFLNSIFAELLCDYFNSTDLGSKVITIGTFQENNDVQLTLTATSTLSRAKLSFIDYVLESGRYELLTPQEQATYAVYKSGSNVIDNLNGSYKNDIWNILIGQSRGNFIQHFNRTQAFYFYNNKIKVTLRCTDSTVANDLLWYAEYTPITNPFICDEKSCTPLNETGYKSFGKSYNNSDSYIDFDKLMTGITTTNNTIGREELSIELNVTESTIPVAKKKIVYGNNEFYISSAITTYGFDKTTTVINCVKDYNKVADCIGVESQFNSTKNPYNNIVERPIFMSDTFPSSFDPANKEFYFVMQFKDTNGNNLSKVVNGVTYNKYIVRASFQIHNNTAYFFASMDDEYSIRMGAVGTVQSNTEIAPIPYVLNNNEIYQVGIQLVYNISFSKTESYLIPLLSSTKTYSTISTKQVVLYKDAREKLTFTFKIKLT